MEDLRIYLDIGNSNIKLLSKNTIKIYKSTFSNFNKLIKKYNYCKWIIIITNINKDKFIDILNKNNIDYKNISYKNLKNINLNEKIKIEEVGIDILLASQYLKNDTGVIIMNGTYLVSILVIKSKITSVSIQLGVGVQSRICCKSLNVNCELNYWKYIADNTLKSISLANYISIYGIINFYKQEYKISKFILTGNGFSNFDLNYLISNKYKIQIIDNLVLKMLQKLI